MSGNSDGAGSLTDEDLDSLLYKTSYPAAGGKDRINISHNDEQFKSYMGTNGNSKTIRLANPKQLDEIASVVDDDMMSPGKGGNKRRATVNLQDGIASSLQSDADAWA
jgi:hypothetical protein